MLVQGKLLSKQDDLSDVYNIIRKVLVNEIELSDKDIIDEFVKKSFYALVYEGTQKKAVATGKITFDGDLCSISRIAVLKDSRKKGYGDFTTRLLIGKAFKDGVKTIYLKTKPDCKSFFAKFGFRYLNKENRIDYSDLIEMVMKEEWYTTGCDKKNK